MNFISNPRNKIMLQVFLSYTFSFLIAVTLYLLFTAANVPKESIAGTDSVWNTVYIFGVIIIETIILILLFKYFKKINIVKIIDIIVTLFAVFGICSIFFNSVILCLLISGLIVVIKELSNNFWFKNFIIFVVVGFFSAYIGYSLGVLPIMLLLILIAVYDYIAVFKTKHMLTLANNIVGKNTLFVMDYGSKVPNNNKKEITDINQKMVTEKDFEPNKRNHLHLGTGDFALPLMGIITLFAVNWILGLIAFFACLFGLQLTIYLLFSQKYVGLPAIPLQVISLLVIYGFYFLFELIL